MHTDCPGKEVMEKGLSPIGRVVRRVSQPWHYLRVLTPANLSRTANRHLTKKPEYSVRIAGVRTPIWLRSDNSDYRILRHTIGRRDVDIALKTAPKFIIDAGANIGCSALWFANRWPDAKILAIEPDADNCRIFQRNCEAYPNITLVQGAVWSNRANLRISNPEVSSCSFQMTESNSDRSMASVRGYTIPELIELAGADRISLLKVDIEGAEIELLKHSANWIHRVDNMMIETHDRFRPGCTAALSNAVSSLPATHYQQGELEIYHFQRVARAA
jgi:FkbM family methyltransferase